MIWTPGTGQLADDGKPYYYTSGAWSVARMRGDGKWFYALWKQPKKLIGIFPTARAAQDEANKLEVAA